MLQILSKITGEEFDFNVDSIYDLCKDNNLMQLCSFMNCSVMSYILAHHQIYIDGIEYTS